MDSSRAWLIVADNNDEGENDYNDNEGDDDGLQADSWPNRVTQRLTHRHVRRSSTRVNVKRTTEWNNKLS